MDLQSSPRTPVKALTTKHVRVKRVFAAIIASTAICLSFTNATNPAHAENAQFKQAIQTYNQGKYGPALQQFETVARSYPSDALTRYYMGLCYQNLNQVAQATQMYQWVKANARSPQLKQMADSGLASVSRYAANRSHAGSAPAAPPPPATAAAPAAGGTSAPAAPAATTAAAKGKTAVKKALYFKTAWCRTCLGFTPQFEAAKEKLGKEVDFQELDLEDGANAELAKKYNVATQPTIVLLDSAGKVLMNRAGAPHDFVGTIEQYK